MVGPASPSSSSPLDRFYQECESIASGIPQLTNGRYSLQDKIVAAYQSAIKAVEQEMESKGLPGSSDGDKVRILSEGSAKLALIETAYSEALKKIAEPKGSSIASANPPILRIKIPRKFDLDPSTESVKSQVSAGVPNAINDSHAQVRGAASSTPPSYEAAARWNSSRGAAKLQVTAAADRDAIVPIAGPKLTAPGIEPGGAASSAPQSSQREPKGSSLASANPPHLRIKIPRKFDLDPSLESVKAPASAGVPKATNESHAQVRGEPSATSPTTMLSSKGSAPLAASKNVFEKIVKGLEVPKLYPSLANAGTGANSTDRISQRNDFSRRLTTLLEKIHDLSKTRRSESKILQYSELIIQGLKLLEDIDHDPQFLEEFGSQIDTLLLDIEYMRGEIKFLKKGYINQLTD